MNYIIDLDEIDYKKLKNDLTDYFGTGMTNISPIMMIELSKIDKCTKEKLVKLAINNGFDISKYYINKYYKKIR